MKKPILFAVAGTRPEVLKLAPVIRHLRSPESALAVRTCFSGQHIEILESVLGDLDVTPDVDLRSTSSAKSLSGKLAELIDHVDEAVGRVNPDGVIVQGDTNTVLAGAMVAFHRQLPLFHVEAGLRTSDPNTPFPEEMNRRLVSRMAALHFAPTTRAKTNLLRDGVSDSCIRVTGNTGVDALRIYGEKGSQDAEATLGKTRPGSRKIMVTLHRRENADRVQEVTGAIRRLIAEDPDLDVLWILHLNGIRKHVTRELSGHRQVHLLEPQSYCSFVNLMKASTLILTDSGGVQEEAPVLGKPVLVLREDTERREAVDAGCAKVVGCDRARILEATRSLLRDKDEYERMSQAQSPFGDGHASERIVEAMEDFYLGELAEVAGMS